MDRKTFETVLRGFWDYLGLGEPEFGGEPELILSVDDFDVVLRHGEDGRMLVVEAAAGALTENAAFRRTEAEKLLKTSFALNAVRNTIAVLEEGGSSAGPRVLVRAFYRYGQNDFRKLEDLVSDVISSGETLQQVLTGARDEDAVSGAARGQSRQRDDELMIFTP